ncbi:polar amino acid transport system permease protein [Angulomicrobium tetraedrale]|uniref:Polar amino acid transport system permease protein n=1 Tax=Ancylobacter tetraedralis TaxID=217068 RepID=A0A839Z920_9HYPH|nr:amino acid ABC transporter permease [Ancylobacter tetraedralis]MBB3770177.1 polar amino acid transport system permease protein [Ancylobacter tetraedralis]
MTQDMLLTMVSGVPWTIALTAVALLIGVVLGIPLCAMRMSKLVVLRMVANTLILTLRAIPPIVWLFFIFFGLDTGYVSLNPFQAAAIGLGLITAANMAEIYRGAMSAIHSGQSEASMALGLSTYHRFFDVLGPQLFRVALPSAASYAIGLLKDSAIASTIGVHEIAFEASHVSQRTFRGLDVYAVAGLLYILLSLPIAWASRWADLHLRARVAR